MDAFNTNDFTPPEVRLKKRRKISKEEEEEEGPILSNLKLDLPIEVSYQ